MEQEGYGNEKTEQKSAGAGGRKYEIDMCNGPLLGKILIFYVPLMLSGILQLLFNAADIVVVGRFAGNESLAAVGATGSLTNLIVNLFIGLSVGANVLVDYKTDRFGSKEEMKKYSVQLRLYKAAMDLILPLPVKACYIYSFALADGEEIML